jgi:hypothetical protein
LQRAKDHISGDRSAGSSRAKAGFYRAIRASKAATGAGRFAIEKALAASRGS